MKRVLAFVLLFFALVAVPAAASAALKPDDDPTIVEGLRDKGFDWLKDKAKGAGQDWLFETGQSETMHEILLKARERADGEGNDKNGLCQGAVMGKASSILNDINYKWSAKSAGKLAFDTAVKMGSLASGFGAAAGEGNALNWVIEQYTDAAKDAGKNAVFDKIKELFGKEKKPEFELYEESGANGDCDYTLRAVWDIVHGTYRVYIEGDCHCKTVGNAGAIPRPLGKWWISFEGHLKLDVDRQKKTTSWTVLPVSKMDFDAQCACSKRELRKAFVNMKPETPMTTGGGTPGKGGPPPLPPAGRKVCKECQKIQDEIDADHKSLREAQAQVRELAGELAGAQNRLAYAKDHPGPNSARDIAEAEGDIKRIKAESARLETEQARLMAQLRDLATQLEECLKKNCPPGKPVNETPPAIPPENKKKGVSYEPSDPFAARILDVHNAERATVGAPPLKWNFQLQQDATGWAQELARTGQLVHAPREGRGIERENLSEGDLWWSTDQMLNNWLKEKRNFKVGLYPDVSITGKWDDVSHYTQMIWPTTTDVGCGMATGGGFKWLVCRYSPGGNKEGKPVGQPPVLAGEQPKVPEKPTAYQWIDVKTGKPVASFPVITDPNGPAGHKTDWVRPDPSDPSRAYDPRTGRNFAKDNGAWIDTKTGKPVASFPVITDPNGPAGQKTDWIRPDPSDPNRAYDPRTGRNFAKVPVEPKSTRVPERGR